MVLELSEINSDIFNDYLHSNDDFSTIQVWVIFMKTAIFVIVTQFP